MAVIVTVAMTAATEQQHARDVHRQSEHRDGYGLVEVDADRPDQPRHRLVADEYGDHGQHHSAGEPRQIAELAGAEAEALVLGVRSRIAVSQSREQQRAGMRRHVQTVGDQRDRTEDPSAHDLRNHHHGAERDHHPGAAFVALVARAEKDVRVIALEGVRHGGPSSKLWATQSS